MKNIQLATILMTMLCPSIVMAQTCAEPPTCTANQASSWNGTAWTCVNVPPVLSKIQNVGLIPASGQAPSGIANATYTNPYSYPVEIIIQLVFNNTKDGGLGIIKVCDSTGNCAGGNYWSGYSSGFGLYGADNNQNPQNAVSFSAMIPVGGTATYQVDRSVGQVWVLY